MNQIYANSVNPFPQVTAHRHSGISVALHTGDQPFLAPENNDLTRAGN